MGATTKAPRSCQVFPEFSFEWLESEFDTVATRTADPFYISDETKAVLHETYKYWKGKTTSDLATAYTSPEAATAVRHNMFTVGNYFYNGIGHVTVDYGKILKIGFSGLKKEVEEELATVKVSDANYCKKSSFLKAVIISLDAACAYARRYSAKAKELAEKEGDASCPR